MEICDKISYDTHKEAQDAIKGLNRRQKRSLHSYKCKECGKFHLASNGKKKWIRNLRDKEIHLTPVKLPKVKSRAKKPQAAQQLATEKLLSKEMINFLKNLIDGQHEGENLTYTTI